MADHVDGLSKPEQATAQPSGFANYEQPHPHLFHGQCHKRPRAQGPKPGRQRQGEEQPDARLPDQWTIR